jgi:fatty acid oxidation complex beta subunit FadI
MGANSRVVVIDGCRTPFLRSGTEFFDLSGHELGRMAVAGLLHKTGIDPDAVELLVMGAVLQDPRATNVAREVVLSSGLPHSCAAYTVTMACISSLQAFIDAARAIATGEAEVAIAGGLDTLSDAPIRFRRPVRRRLIAAQKARGAASKLKLLAGLKLSDLLPEAPAIAELSTGETMGQTCERLAKRLGITRQEQDEYALASHQRAARATSAGWLARQIVPAWPPPGHAPIAADNGVRGDTTMERLSALAPAFDRRLGTVTAGNSSFLTDGAAAVLLASEKKAAELRLEPIAAVRSVAVTGMDPREELLLGPAFASPRALDDAGWRLEDVEVVELHEAFAAQVLAVLKVLGDDRFCRERLGRDGPVGSIDRTKLNAWGGSLSIGHPFGATGARLLTTCCHRLQHENARTGLVAACAGGALGIAIALERA